jgi:hypothetical protein
LAVAVQVQQVRLLALTVLIVNLLARQQLPVRVVAVVAQVRPLLARVFTV